MTHVASVPGRDRVLVRCSHSRSEPDPDLDPCEALAVWNQESLPGGARPAVLIWTRPMPRACTVLTKQASTASAFLPCHAFVRRMVRGRSRSRLGDQPRTDLSPALRNHDRLDAALSASPLRADDDE